MAEVSAGEVNKQTIRNTREANDFVHAKTCQKETSANRA